MLYRQTAAADIYRQGSTDRPVWDQPVSVRGSLFTGSSSGELTKWESQPHSKYIYLSDNYRKGSPDMCNSGTSVTPSMVR